MQSDWLNVPKILLFAPLPPTSDGRREEYYTGHTDNWVSWQDYAYEQMKGVFWSTGDLFDPKQFSTGGGKNGS